LSPTILTAGAHLGPFEIVDLLGVGGMGEVYRATDTNLKRQVAIKVLPTTVAADSDQLARFQREAEVLAALNHPNIAHIFGLEKTDGTLALVMELVEGPTLADRIAQSAIPLAEVLSIAKQIAEALEAAHERGIIHRDLKPAKSDQLAQTSAGIVIASKSGRFSATKRHRADDDPARREIFGHREPAVPSARHPEAPPCADKTRFEHAILVAELAQHVRDALQGMMAFRDGGCSAATRH
jgi:hypothetical protein